MLRIFFFLLVIAALSLGLSYVADMDGTLIIQWPGGEIQPSLMQAVLVFAGLVVLAIVVWSLLRMILSSPEAVGRYFRRKKQEKGLAALSGGLIALGAGDKSRAAQLAGQARKTLPNDPMTQMLRAQAAELQGDTGQATRIYESMLAAADTEVMGLRGLYLLALEQKELEAAEQYAARAVRRRADLQWAVLGLFDLQCKRQNWAEALETLEIAKGQRHVTVKTAKRQRAVLLTALALDLEDDDMDTALGYASEAVKLAPSLVPAAVVAGRINASKGHMGQALSILRRCWKKAPHPDLAMVSAFARPGDSVRDRLSRIQSLADLTPGHREAALAVAEAAFEAQDWKIARESLAPLIRGRPTKRVCLLMSRIEAADGGNKGAVREWLSRAVSAPFDPQWVADGVVQEEWAPISPISGKLDVFEWVQPDEHEGRDAEMVTLEHMVAGLLAVESLECEPDVVEVETSVQDDTEPVAFTASVVEPNSNADDVAEGEIVKVEPQTDPAGEDAVVVTETQPAEESVVKRDKKPATKKRKRRKKTKIFVAPPAPDDPGPEEEQDETGFVPGVRPARY